MDGSTGGDSMSLGLIHKWGKEALKGKAVGLTFSKPEPTVMGSMSF